MKLKIEVNAEFAAKNHGFESTDKSTVVLVTPAIDEDYWLARVKLSKRQAIVCFPKFFTVGIGFQEEEDWNTNLPYTIDSAKIFSHIKRNKGDARINDEDCIEAIKMLQSFVAERVMT